MTLNIKNKKNLFLSGIKEEGTQKIFVDFNIYEVNGVSKD